MRADPMRLCDQNNSLRYCIGARTDNAHGSDPKLPLFILNSSTRTVPTWRDSCSAGAGWSPSPPGRYPKNSHRDGRDCAKISSMNNNTPSEIIGNVPNVISENLQFTPNHSETNFVPIRKLSERKPS